MNDFKIPLWGKWLIAGLIVFFIVNGVLSSYNTAYLGHTRRSEEVKSTWGEVVNSYQRRADLIPNLVESVKGYSFHESDILKKIAEAHKGIATKYQSAPELTPGNVQAFNRQQTILTNALAPIMMLTQQYPELKANEHFKEFQAELSGTENRIKKARTDYINAVKEYNIHVQSSALTMDGMVARMRNLEVKPSFEVDNEKEISHAPKISFQQN